ncbi:MAG: DUF4382 domain-containing protein, partial [Gemmatimonadota bacterium]
EIEEITLQGDDGPVVLLNESTGLIELTDLVLGELEELAVADIPPGVYGQLRLRIEHAVLETDDDDFYVMGTPDHPDAADATGTLMCPSCDQSGLKVILHGMELAEGDESILVLDFDVSQSFGRQAGMSGKWIMRPVIHAAHFPGDGKGPGDGGVSIEGQVVLAPDIVIPECAGSSRDVRDFVPTATATTLVDEDQDPVVRTGTVDDDGEFKINFLEPDIYDLGYEASIVFDGYTLDFTAEVSPAEAEIDAEDVEGIVYTITDASCEAIATGG